VSPPTAVDLSVDIGALHLRNPVIAASGTFGYGIEFVQLTDLSQLGAIVVKGLSLEPMEGAPAPRLVPTTAGMINAVGLQNVGVRRFISEKLPALRSYPTPVIANVFGRTVEEYAEVVCHLEGAEDPWRAAGFSSAATPGWLHRSWLRPERQASGHYG